MTLDEAGIPIDPEPYEPVYPEGWGIVDDWGPPEVNEFGETRFGVDRTGATWMLHSSPIYSLGDES